MSKLKNYIDKDVLTACHERTRYAFDNFRKVYVSFSGGKDSTVMLHIAAMEARARSRKIGVLIIDLEAQYIATIEHMEAMILEYADVLDVHWVCLPLSLRNAVSNFEPRWICWESGLDEKWVRQRPQLDCVVSDGSVYPFFEDAMEFEEFMVLWGEWYSDGESTCALIGIRADESLNRFRTIASATKEMHGGMQFTTKVTDSLYNLYPVYDWKTQDIWRFHSRFPQCRNNRVYDLMHKAGLSIHQMRLCQPYGDDQRRGLWLYHLLEADTWYRVVDRVSGANSGALYVGESGNVAGYGKITKPDGHTWESFCRLLISTLPPISREHYTERFRDWIYRWKQRGYDQIPDEAPPELEAAKWAPSWRRLCKVLLRNDWWCKGLGLTQPKSAAYERYMNMKKNKKADTNG